MQPTPGRARRQALVVLGMHRSGTSALAGMLAACGAGLPGHLIPASRKNRRGYFESQTLYELHEELLAEAGSSWDDPAPLPSAWFASSASGRWEQRLAEAVRSEFGDSALFVLKDPRLCRLLPLWRRILLALEVEPLFVLPVRNPFEVASSLLRSGGIVPARALLLWLDHWLAAERDTRGSRRCFVLYTDLLSDWRKVLQRISSGLGVGFARISRTAEAEIDAFLAPELRHEVNDPGDVFERSDVHPWVRDAYRWALAAAGPEGEPPGEALDRIRAQWEPAEAAFGPALAAVGIQQAGFEKEIAELRRELEEERAVAPPLRERLAEKRAEVDRLTVSVRMLLRWVIERGRTEHPANPALRAMMEAANAASGEELPRIASAAAWIADQRLDIARLEKERVTRAGEIEKLSIRIAELEGQLRERDARLRESTSELELARIEQSRQRAESLRQAQQLRELSTAAQGASAEAARLAEECGRWMARANELAQAPPRRRVVPWPARPPRSG